ncbi:MAG TPA: polyphosphate kinase 1, partial [Phycisphaerales bacterium]|nr:polyphosphate kinase 1 [Phycisphaerales bacterium]
MSSAIPKPEGMQSGPEGNVPAIAGTIGTSPSGSAATTLPAPIPTGTPEADMSSPFLNRDLQWLEFNDRVLSQAVDERTPLLERVRFLAIFSSNLDEFFMKRVGGLRRQLEAGVTSVTPDNISPTALLSAIRQRVLPMVQRKATCYRSQIIPALRDAGIHLLNYSDLSKSELRQVQDWFMKDVFPLLTPLAVDPGHRFPFISNLSVSLGVIVRRPGATEQLFARVKVPESMPQWWQVPGTMRFVLLQEIIERNLGALFPGMEIVKVLPFRVTRNADIEGDIDDAEDLLEEIQQQLRERRFAPVVRMQIMKKSNRRLLEFLSSELEIRPDDLYETEGLINFRSLEQIANLDLPAHRFKPWTGLTPLRLKDRHRDVFSVIRQGDVLVHHPYESFEASVERFIKEAANDPAVVCIKQTLYRTSGESAFVPALIRAAELGKQVAAVIELRARFDEAKNIEWGMKLEDAGVHVTYGVMGLKTHAKTALVVRREAEGLRSYVHMGSGNYNSGTARVYEDLGLFTCDPAICDDVIDLFNSMTGRSRQSEYTKLLVAPHSMKKRFIELIEREMAAHRPDNPGRIVVKINQLQDQEVTEALYRASQAGVKIDLIVRGFCTLRPGVAGLSENIRVMSVIGRFLEHSRIYYFRNGKDDPKEGDFYIGS